jgi:predicted dehydrogenase
VKNKNIVVVGLGPMGRNHVRVLASNNNVLGCDVKEENHDSSIGCYKDVSVLLSEKDVDVAVIATPGPSHFSIAKTLIESGIESIIIEKPLATSVEKCEILQDLAKKQNTKIVVNHSRRWDKNFVNLKTFVKEKSLGSLAHIHTTFGGGRLGCMGTHIFDTWCMLTESSPVKMFGSLDSRYKGDHKGRDVFDPGGYCIAEMKNGTRCTLDICEDIGTPVYHVLSFSLGKVLVDEQSGSWTVIRRKREYLEERLGSYDCPMITLPFQTFKSTFEDCLMGMYSDLEMGIIKCSLEDGKNAVEMCLAIHQSSSDDVPVTLPLVDKKMDVKIT